MRENFWKLEEAHKFVKEKRSIIKPNFGFQLQLKKYEMNLGLIDEATFIKETKFKVVFVN